MTSLTETSTAKPPQIDSYPPTVLAPGTPLPPDPQVGPAHDPHYLVRHWRGELSLPVSYWVNGSLIGLVYGLLLKGANAAIDNIEGLGARSVGVLTLAMFLGLAALGTWQLVGIWRSACKHAARGGSRGWAITAQVLVILGALRLGLALVGQVPTSIVALSLIRGTDDTPAAEVSLADGGQAIEVWGGFEYGTTARTRALLGKAPHAKLIVLNSPGGFVAEGVRMGNLIHEKSLATTTTEKCASACVLAYLAGTKRTLAPDARLGFHQGSIGGRGNRTSSTPFSDALRARGTPEAFIERMLATPPAHMWYPTPEELLDAHVITSLPPSGPDEPASTSN